MTSAQSSAQKVAGMGGGRREALAGSRIDQGLLDTWVERGADLETGMMTQATSPFSLCVVGWVC